MAKALLLVFSNPSDPSREDEYNEWYDNTHVPDVLKVPGFVSGRRYALGPTQLVPGGERHGYLAVYEIDADDPAEAVRTLRRRLGNEIPLSDAMDLPGSTNFVYVPREDD